jgi:hypothetical protein
MVGSGTDTMAGSGSAGSDTMAGSGSAGSDTMAGSGSAGAGSGSAADESMSKKAGNCPSTVFGSTTTATVKGKDVLLTITSTDKDAIATIQRRAEELLKEKADGPGPSGPGAAHDQKGSHGGGHGICPVYWEDGGKATSKKDAKGVVITITPKDKPDELKKKIDERIAKAAEWTKANVKAGEQGTSGGVGGGKGDHGGNHSGSGDSKGKERKGGDGGGAGTGGGGGKGTGGGAGSGSGSAKK